MPVTLIAALTIHVLAGVFWAGTSFALARTGGPGGERLFRPQMGAALVTVVAGGYLWSTVHPPAGLLGVGAAAALVAAGVQGALGGRSIRRLRQGAISPAAAQTMIAIAQRVAAALLALAIISMVAARYV
jgi:hypothetical protein